MKNNSDPARTQGAVLFDLDGTVLDTAPDFERVLNGMLSDRGLAALPSAKIRATVSDGARALITLAFGIGEGAPLFESLRQELLSRYELGLALESAPFPGIPDLLCRFADLGVKWGIVTNKPSRYTDPLLARMNLDPPPAAVVCPDHVNRTKPHPEPLLLACDQMGVSPSDCIYVGDHARDIEAGRHAQMLTVAVSWGYIDEDDSIESWSADHTVNNAGELEQVITTHFRTKKDS